MELTRSRFQTIVQQRGAVLVFFGLPVLRASRELSRQLEAIKDGLDARAAIVVVNVGAETSIAAAMEIEVLPTALLFRHGQEIGRLQGVRPLHHYELALSAAVEALAVEAVPADLGVS